MKVVASAGNKDIAMVYVVEFEGGLVECVEAVQPPRPREEKWVLMISTLFGCPISCQMCDAGGHFRGKLSEGEMFEQIDYLINSRYPDGYVPSKQFKIQFARMGEPALNPAVLDVLKNLPDRVNAPGLMPSLSTIAPKGTSLIERPPLLFMSEGLSINLQLLYQEFMRFVPDAIHPVDEGRQIGIDLRFRLFHHRP